MFKLFSFGSRRGTACETITGNELQVPAESVTVDVTAAELANRSQTEVAQLDIALSKEGEYSRFWISLSLNNRGQVVCEVATNNVAGKTMTKRLSAVKLRKKVAAD